jgi:hypothetical protein
MASTLGKEIKDMSANHLIESLRHSKRRSHRKDFETFDRDSLSSMNDRELAAWQAEFEQDEAQWRLAEHEWQRRLNADMITATIKAARGQAWFGIAGVIMGSSLTLLVTLLLRWLLP